MNPSHEQLERMLERDEFLEKQLKEAVELRERLEERNRRVSRELQEKAAEKVEIRDSLEHMRELETELKASLQESKYELQAAGYKPQQAERPREMPGPQYRPVAQPVSRIQIEQLEKQMHEPTPTLDLKPQGMTNTSNAWENNRRIQTEIDEYEQRLRQREGLAQEPFNRVARRR